MEMFYVFKLNKKCQFHFQRYIFCTIFVKNFSFFCDDEKLQKIYILCAIKQVTNMIKIYEAIDNVQENKLL